MFLFPIKDQPHITLGFFLSQVSYVGHGDPCRLLYVCMHCFTLSNYNTCQVFRTDRSEKSQSKVQLQQAIEKIKIIPPCRSCPRVGESMAPGNLVLLNIILIKSEFERDQKNRKQEEVSELPCTQRFFSSEDKAQS